MDATALKRIPKNIASITGGTFILNGDTVTGFNAVFEVNYGTHGEPVGGDIWNNLDADSKAAAQKLYNGIKTVAESMITEANK